MGVDQAGILSMVVAEPMRTGHGKTGYKDAAPESTSARRHEG